MLFRSLPFGPGKLRAGGTSGVLARAVEGWKLGGILTVSSGAPLNISGQNTLYANGTPDIVGDFNIKGNALFAPGSPSGSYFMGGALRQVLDPQCAQVTTVDNLQAACTLNAVAAANNGPVLLQNPKPGVRGTLGFSSIQAPGRWRFDANLAKSVKLTENKSLQFRMDITNVLNHPEPNVPTAANSLMMNINSANFGLITGADAKTNLHRQLQAQLKFEF